MVVTLVAVGTKSTRGDDARRPTLRLVTATFTAPLEGILRREGAVIESFEERGVHLRPAVDVLSFEPGCVVVRAGTEDTTRVPTDTAIIATPQGSDRRVAADLVAASIAFREIGDCRHFALLEGALLDASELAASMST